MADQNALAEFEAWSQEDDVRDFLKTIPGETPENPLDEMHPELTATERHRIKTTSGGLYGPAGRHLESLGFEARPIIHPLKNITGAFNFAIRKKGKPEPWRKLEPENWVPPSVGEFAQDVADLRRELFLGLSAGLGSVIGSRGGLPGAAAGAGAGAGLTELAYMAGDDAVPTTPQEKALATGIAGTAGVGGEILGRLIPAGVGKAVKTLRRKGKPHGAVKRAKEAVRSTDEATRDVLEKQPQPEFPDTGNAYTHPAKPAPDTPSPPAQPTPTQPRLQPKPGRGAPTTPAAPPSSAVGRRVSTGLHEAGPPTSGYAEISPQHQAAIDRAIVAREAPVPPNYKEVLSDPEEIRGLLRSVPEDQPVTVAFFTRGREPKIGKRGKPIGGKPREHRWATGYVSPTGAGIPKGRRPLRGEEFHKVMEKFSTPELMEHAKKQGFRTEQTELFDQRAEVLSFLERGQDFYVKGNAEDYVKKVLSEGKRPGAIGRRAKDYNLGRMFELAVQKLGGKPRPTHFGLDSITDIILPDGRHFAVRNKVPELIQTTLPGIPQTQPEQIIARLAQEQAQKKIAKEAAEEGLEEQLRKSLELEMSRRRPSPRPEPTPAAVTPEDVGLETVTPRTRHPEAPARQPLTPKEQALEAYLQGRAEAPGPQRRPQPTALPGPGQVFAHAGAPGLGGKVFRTGRRIKGLGERVEAASAPSLVSRGTGFFAGAIGAGGGIRGALRASLTRKMVEASGRQRHPIRRGLGRMAAGGALVATGNPYAGVVGHVLGGQGTADLLGAGLQKLGAILMRDTSGEGLRPLLKTPIGRYAAVVLKQRERGVDAYRAAVWIFLQRPQVREYFAREGPR